MEEVKKAVIAEKHGADTISELSMGGDITAIRKEIFKNSTLPITTVPIYQACAEQGIKKLTWDHILDTVRMQAEEGVSSFVFHCIIERNADITKNEKKNTRRRVQGWLDHLCLHAPEPR